MKSMKGRKRWEWWILIFCVSVYLGALFVFVDNTNNLNIAKERQKAHAEYVASQEKDSGMKITP